MHAEGRIRWAEERLPWRFGDLTPLIPTHNIRTTLGVERYGARSSITQIVLGGLDAAETGRVTTIERGPGALAATGVPLWRPRGAVDLFDGLPVKLIREEYRAS